MCVLSVPELSAMGGSLLSSLAGIRWSLPTPTCPHPTNGSWCSGLDNTIARISAHLLPIRATAVLGSWTPVVHTCLHCLPAANGMAVVGGRRRHQANIMVA